MGTYDYLDGARIKVFYRGNQKTCGRCHEPARTCPGGGIAKDCEEAGGTRINLNEHMEKVWSEIGFQPSNFYLPQGEDCNDEADKPITDKNNFNRIEKPSVVTETLEERFVGMSIANISLEISDEEVKEFILEYVSSELEPDNINIVRDKNKSVVTITENLNKDQIKEAMAKINFKDCKLKFF